MAVTLGGAFQALAHVGHVNQTLLDERMLLDEVPGLGSGDLFRPGAGAWMLLRGRVHDGGVGQGLDTVARGCCFVVVAVVAMVVDGQIGARRGVRGGEGARGRGGAAGGGAQDVVFGAGAVEGGLEAVVVGLQRVGAGLEGRELRLELLDVALLALAEGALAGEA